MNARASFLVKRGVCLFLQLSNWNNLRTEKQMTVVILHKWILMRHLEIAMFGLLCFLLSTDCLFILLDKIQIFEMFSFFFSFLFFWCLYFFSIFSWSSQISFLYSLADYFRQFFDSSFQFTLHSFTHKRLLIFTQLSFMQRKVKTVKEKSKEIVLKHSSN